ncbi:MAG: hypothetical protein WC325_13535, partial [Candidatus Bathyarchaeia archaeon]
HNFLLIVREENYPLSIFWEEIEEGTTEELLNGKPTGWRNTRLRLMEPTDYNPKYAEFGKIHEVVLHYNGKLKDLINLQRGTALYKDMEIPHGHTDTLTVKPIKLAYLNIKHGAKIPI